MADKVAALYVQPNGVYSGQSGVEVWDEARDARLYAGRHPVVSHPPCQRWGRFWHGSTRKPHQFTFGDDKGCFKAALASVRRVGGVIEHPADSGAWNPVDHPTRPGFGLPLPKRGKGWTSPDEYGGRSCYVEQGHYGHDARKATWLYAVGIDFPELDWTAGKQKLPQWMIDRYGYETARRIGVVAMVGGKNKTDIRNATPPAFRDVLLAMARSVKA